MGVAPVTNQELLDRGRGLFERVPVDAPAPESGSVCERRRERRERRTPVAGQGHVGGALDRCLGVLEDDDHACLHRRDRVLEVALGLDGDIEPRGDGASEQAELAAARDEPGLAGAAVASERRSKWCRELAKLLDGARVA